MRVKTLRRTGPGAPRSLEPLPSRIVFDDTGRTTDDVESTGRYGRRYGSVYGSRYVSRVHASLSAGGNTLPIGSDPRNRVDDVHPPSGQRWLRNDRRSAQIRNRLRLSGNSTGFSIGLRSLDYGEYLATRVVPTWNTRSAAPHGRLLSRRDQCSWPIVVTLFRRYLTRGHAAAALPVCDNNDRYDRGQAVRRRSRGRGTEPECSRRTTRRSMEDRTSSSTSTASRIPSFVFTRRTGS